MVKKLGRRYGRILLDQRERGMDTSIPVAASAVLHAGRYRIAQHSEDAAHGPSSGSHRLCYSCKWPLAAPWLDVHQAGGRNRRRSCCVAQKIGLSLIHISEP